MSPVRVPHHSPSATDIVLTFDIDWAPDWMVGDIAGRLAAKGIRATFFATHNSPAMRDLESEPAFEIGLHPNLLPGSSHGGTEEEVFGALKDWFPRATTCRTHSLVQSERLLERMATVYGISIDCSLHLPRAANVEPHILPLTVAGASILRVPHIFQDNMHMLARREWTMAAAGLDRPGWKVMNFHPVHVSLNISRMDTYEAIRKRTLIQKLSRDDVGSSREPGAGTFLADVIAHLAGSETATITEEVSRWQAAGADQ